MHQQGNQQVNYSYPDFISRDPFALDCFINLCWTLLPDGAVKHMASAEASRGGDNLLKGYLIFVLLLWCPNSLQDISCCSSALVRGAYTTSVRFHLQLPVSGQWSELQVTLSEQVTSWAVREWAWGRHSKVSTSVCSCTENFVQNGKFCIRLGTTFLTHKKIGTALFCVERHTPGGVHNFLYVDNVQVSYTSSNLSVAEKQMQLITICLSKWVVKMAS